MHIISKHLPESPIKSLMQRAPPGAICAFTGFSIVGEWAIPKSNSISDVFTDYAAIRYQSDWVSVDAAKCLLPVIDNGRGGYNSLRNYSFYANEKEFMTIQRQDILLLMEHWNETPFVLAVSFDNKKHLAYRCALNRSTEKFTVTTDKYGDIECSWEHISLFLSLVQSWYTVVAGKEGSAQQPTYFTKEEIRTGRAPYQKQKVYGLERFERENETLQHFRDTAVFELIIHLVNKSL